MNYNIYPQQQYIPVQQQQTYRPVQNYTWGAATPQVRPVSSIEEVKASPIDFDGSIFYFPDVANKKIYTKSINIDGTVTINIYELSTDQSTDQLYITRQEFEEVINELKSSILKPVPQEIQQPAAQSPQMNF